MWQVEKGRGPDSGRVNFHVILLVILDGGSRPQGLNVCTLDSAEGLASVWKTHVNGVAL